MKGKGRGWEGEEARRLFRGRRVAGNVVVVEEEAEEEEGCSPLAGKGSS